MNPVHRTTPAVLAMLSLATFATSASALSPDSKCDYARSRANASYTYCLAVRQNDGAAACIERLGRVWPKLQQITGSDCDAERWVDNLDGTTTDNLTGLVWEQKTNLDSVANPGDPHDADNTYDLTNDDADLTDDDGTAYTDFLASLNSGAGFAGGNGWRLPTLEELDTIFVVVNGQCVGTPCADPALGPVFSEPDSANYWSSSALPSTQAWGHLAEDTPQSVNNAERTGAFHVRAVRGGLPAF